MFTKSIYIARRDELKKRVGNGIIILFGNNDAPCNYPANAYRYRQDSSFLYFFGQKREGLVGVIDVDNNKEYLFGNDIDIDDIVWFGYVPSVKELAAEVGVDNSAPMSELRDFIDRAQQLRQPIHFLPQYRGDIQIQMADLFGFHPLETREKASLTLIKAIVAMRRRKRPEEIEEMRKAAEIGYDMHVTAMKQCREGVTEHYIAGLLDGIAMSRGCGTSFQTILTQHGEIQHGMPTFRTLEAGRMILCDAGAENQEFYCSDNTRVTPVSGRFTEQQKAIYLSVKAAHDWVMAEAKPGVRWLDIHLGACRILTDHLKQLGLMKGNTDDAVAQGAHALFMPHGVGHHMGLDVHDMEGLGQIYVGFNDEIRPSTQFGLNCLRCGIPLEEGFVMTDEPGCYFIPHLIDLWKGQGMHKEYINYDEVEKYRDFGGIRLEDDLLITAAGNRLVGDKMIPIEIDDVEALAGVG